MKPTLKKPCPVALKKDPTPPAKKSGILVFRARLHNPRPKPNNLNNKLANAPRNRNFNALKNPGNKLLQSNHEKQATTGSI